MPLFCLPIFKFSIPLIQGLLIPASITKHEVISVLLVATDG